ncbi:MAG: PadR family transcriptional regulator [Gammaproteobacteria bacterium]|nr:PadR family transcriptional regulator [Gammaproteobacteria bacterium]
MFTDEYLGRMRLELRRGMVIIAVLLQLRTEHYGYALRQALEARGLDIDEGTLYPLIRRLEFQGLLTSEWREEDRRNKRFYAISTEGRAALKQLLTEWDALETSINSLRSGKAS